MEYLLHPRNLKILESFCLVKTLFAFDYDGTLAPIADDPAAAFMKENTAALLKELNDVSPVAIITGRTREDVMRFLPINPAFVIGNHGAEGTQSVSDLDRMKALTRSWLKHLNDVLPILDNLGVRIEDKVYSLSFHYRNSLSPEVAEGALTLMLARLPQARIMGGKFVFNALPEFSVDKGMALELIMKENQYQFGVYFGDDQTDEDVFHYNNPRMLTVKIGTDPTEAKFFLRQQNEINEVLKSLTAFIANGRTFV